LSLGLSKLVATIALESLVFADVRTEAVLLGVDLPFSPDFPVTPVTSSGGFPYDVIVGAFVTGFRRGRFGCGHENLFPFDLIRFDSLCCSPSPAIT
jgi:hypothetical protein